MIVIHREIVVEIDVRHVNGSLWIFTKEPPAGVMGFLRRSNRLSYDIERICDILRSDNAHPFVLIPCSRKMVEYQIGGAVHINVYTAFIGATAIPSFTNPYVAEDYIVCISNKEHML